VASTIFSTGEFPELVGNNGLETKTRWLSPLVEPVVLVLLELLPQEIKAPQAATSKASEIRTFLKQGTPDSMRDRNLDARKRDYNRAI
jgi:hypothetical protein